MTLHNALKYSADVVGMRDAVLLVSCVTGCSHEDILLRGDNVMPEGAEDGLMRKLKRLMTDEPLQYVLGTWDFMGLEFLTDARALIPRPETELLAEAVLKHLNYFKTTDYRHSCLVCEGFRILDLCTGTGCIGLSLAWHTNFMYDVVLADVSKDALELAKENRGRILAKAVCQEAASRISLHLSDLMSNVPGSFDIIVSNPPYIPSNEIASLAKNVKNHEPCIALDGGIDGLDIYRRLIPQSHMKLKDGGAIFLEIGPNEAADLVEQTGFCDIEVIKDYAGHNRVVKGVKKCLIN